MISWQERYVLWILRQKCARLSENLSHWWVFALFGVLWGAMMIYLFAVLLPGLFDISLSTAVAHSEMDDQEKIAFLLGQETFLQDSFVLIMRYVGFGLAGVATLFSLFVGLIWEERKGYRRVIERLQAQSQATGPNQTRE